MALMTATWEGTGLRIVAIRRRVSDPSAPPQGKVIPESSEWRYQALITDRDWEAVDVWRFYNHRGDSERVFRVAKQVLALGNLVSRDFRANESAFLLRLLAYNADIAFQQDAEEKAAMALRPVLRNGLEWRQRRFYDSPGRLLRERSRWVLRTATNFRLAELWSFYDHDRVALGA